MDKKIIFGLIALVIAVIIIVLLIVMTKQNPNPGKIILKDGITIDPETCSKLSKVTVIHTTGCSACAVAIPRLQELEQELNMSFSYYDLAIENKRQEILDMNLIPQAVPTVIINCKVYVGVRSKDDYKTAIEE